MQHYDDARGFKAAHGVFQAEGFVYRLRHEPLDRRLAERAEHPAAKSARESLHSGEAHAADLAGLALQQMHARLANDGGNLLRRIAFIIVVAQHGDDRDGAEAETFGQDFRLAGLAEIGQVAAQNEYVGGS